MEKFNYTFVRLVISGNSSNSDPEYNLHVSTVIKHHSGLCSIKNKKHLAVQFWVTFDKLVTMYWENDQLEVESVACD
jgi:hypothetical protein